MSSTISNLPVAQKLALMVGVPVALIIAISGLLLVKSEEVNKLVGVNVRAHLEALDGQDNVSTQTGAAVTMTYRYLLQDDDAGRAAAKKSAEESFDIISKEAVHWSDAVKGTTYEAKVKECVASSQEIVDACKTALSISGSARKQEVDKFDDAVTKLAPEFYKLDDELADEMQKDSGAAVDTTVSTLRHMVSMALWASLVAVFSSVAFGVFVARSIRNPLRVLGDRLSSISNHCASNLSAGLQRFAAGDLTMDVQPATTPIEIDRKDEFGVMAETFNSTLGKVQDMVVSYNEARYSLSDLVSHVNRQSEDVLDTSNGLAAAAAQSGVAATEIADTSQRLAQNATDAASSMDGLNSKAADVGTSSSKQAMAVAESESVLEQAGEGILSVAAAAQQVSALANQGDRSVRDSVNAMKTIKERAERSAADVQELDHMGQKIGDIVSAIEQIAEQTNLLALNAAIEAARAGEHGRGFAVVAEEVRKLAEQAGSSTKEISALIEGVTSRVEATVAGMAEVTAEVSRGTEKTVEAGDALAQILAAAGDVAQSASNVSKLTARASEEMKALAGLAEKNLGATEGMSVEAEHVSDAICAVAAASEETAAATQELTASVEEVSAAAASLADMSRSLKESVSKFKMAEARKVEIRLAA